MAKKRPDYQTSFPGRFSAWIKNGCRQLDESMEHEYDESAPQLLPDPVTDVETIRTLYAKKQRWQETKGQRIARRVQAVVSVAVALVLIGLLLYTTVQLPSFGVAGNPVNNEVSRRYIEQGMQETGAVNIVGGMILDYRAFDTLGESNVLFIAACTVIILLRISNDKESTLPALQLRVESNDRSREPKDDAILMQVTKVLMPVALLFGMYVIMNGHISPGGGFSGGAIMGAGLILYLVSFGFTRTRRFFTFRTFRIVSLCALSFYALSKAYSFFTGANHLYSIITPGIPGKLFSAGLIPYLNLAVGLVVCCTMYAFYTIFRRGDM